MAQLSTGAIIVIVIVACLAAVSLGAALTRQYNPQEDLYRHEYPREQQVYMRSLRLKNLGMFHRDAGTPLPRDVESAVMTTDNSSRY